MPSDPFRDHIQKLSRDQKKCDIRALIFIQILDSLNTLMPYLNLIVNIPFRIIKQYAGLISSCQKIIQDITGDSALLMKDSLYQLHPQKDNTLPYIRQLQYC